MLPADASRRAAFSACAPGTDGRVAVLVSVCRMDDVAGKETVYCDRADPCLGTLAKPELCVCR